MKNIFLILCFCCPFVVFTQKLVSDIEIIGNVKTKEKVILRELLFKVGDSLSTDVLAEYLVVSRNNLWNTFLFNQVSCTYADSAHSFWVKIEVEERWYWWPEPIFEFQERNFTEWYRNRDLSRLDYGAFLTHTNMRGLSEKLKLMLRFGFNQSLGFDYQVPNLGKKKQNGFNLGYVYTTQNELFLAVEENLMVYQKLQNQSFLQYQGAYVEFVKRKEYFAKNQFKVSWERLSLNDSITHFQLSFLPKNKVNLINFRYVFKYDKRDSRNYPLKGYYFDVQIHSDHPVFDFWEESIQYIKFNARHFIDLAPRWNFSYGGYTEVFRDVPRYFYFQNGLGFNQYVRGYEHYVIFGKQSHVAKTNLKYTLLSPYTKELSFVPVKEFNKFILAVYSNVFIDVGYVGENLQHFTQELNQQFLMGGGLGLDFVSYYDLVFRIEFSRNIEGRNGVYLAFTAPL